MIDPAKLTDAMTASGGRWRVTPDRHHNGFAVVDEAGLLVADSLNREEARAIVRVRNSVPDLLDEIKRLTGHVKDVRTCPACGCPCATIRALDADA